MVAYRRSEDLDITFGVEEEFFLVDPETRDLVAEPDQAIFHECALQAGEHKVAPEFLRSQLETATAVCRNIAQVRQALTRTRSAVVNAAESHGTRAIAASIHPFAAWSTQVVSVGRRYEEFALTYQEAVRRLIIGGMHVHVGFGDNDTRIRVMTALRRHLPLLHALSGSSPFHGGRETGFKSYRLTIFGSLPRTGVPRPLGSWQEFDALTRDYRRMHLIENAGELWWDIRPSHVYPTVEMRICDVCPRIEDAIAITALYGCLVRYLWRRDIDGTLPLDPATEIINENRWLAQRYGVLAFFGNLEGGGRMDIDDYAQDLVRDLADDAKALKCEAELRHVLEIVRNGSGADRQVDLFRLRRLEGASHDEALTEVVDLIIRETKESLD